MASISKTCRLSGKPFTVTDADQAFYEKMNVPIPTLCPEERERRRLAWRTERYLFPRQCNSCKNYIVSMFPENVSWPVYCNDCFWSDKWSPLSDGQDFDFSRPFFEQFASLMQKVPRIYLFTANSVNSEYTLNSIWNKNCYLTSGADYNEDCFYGINTQKSKNCVDSYFLIDSERNYACIDSERIYQCVGCQDCENCSDSWFLYDCKGSKNCAFSSNLRNKEYVLFNEQLSKEEYEIKLKEALQKAFDNQNWLEDSLAMVRKNAVHRAAKLMNSENAYGNNISNSRNVYNCFDVDNLQDCKYVHFSVDASDSYDLNCAGWKASLLYEVMSAGDNVYNVRFSNAVINSSNIDYSLSIWNSKDCFGSISLHANNQYVILNKQYNKLDYEDLKVKIIEYMKSTGEWGEYFPAALAPFEYNRSAAIDYLPLDKEAALHKGFDWYDEPALASERSEDFLNCIECNKIYRPIKQELNFYVEMGVPIPKHCWPCRLRKLMAARKPRKLFNAKCLKCEQDLIATIRDAGEKLYCEDCYLSEVY